MATIVLKSNGINKQPTIQLKKYGRKIREIEEFGRQLISKLGDNIFYIQSKQVLLYNLLKQISHVNKSLQPDNASIEKACEKVIKHFGLNREVVIKSYSDTGWKEIKNEKKSNTDKFCEFIIGIDKVPGTFYDQLLSEVNKDLNALTELINWYETHPCIQKYIKDNEIPKSHEHRILYDFYKRCINERVEIFNYQLYGVKQRALAKARYAPKWLISMRAFSEMFKNRPYYFAHPFSTHYFDSRKIDLVGHRIDNLSIDEGREMQKIYSENKAKFYRIYFKRMPIQQLFQNLKFYLPALPLSKNRILIFDELIKLFKARRWIGFYALALPQVEGLFSEMCLAISPEKDLSRQSLMQKVDSVRPFHEFSRYYFDYYQYYIPFQRNRFSHTGYDEDFKLKSYDLLVDLSHILKIFSELNNSLVKIKRLHTRRNFEDFITLTEFAGYFRLLDDLKPQQKKEIKDDIDSFEKEFLCRECNVDYICYEMIQELPKKIGEFIDYINTTFKNRNVSVDFERLTIPDIENILKEEKEREIVTSCFLIKNEAVETLENYALFLMDYKKNLPTLQNEIKKELANLQTKHGNALKTITYTDLSIKKLKEI